MKKFSKNQTVKMIGAFTLSLIFMGGLTSCSKEHCAAYSKVSGKQHKTKNEAKMGKRLAFAKR